MQEYFKSELKDKCPYDILIYIDNIHNVWDERLKVIRCDLELKSANFTPIEFEYCTKGTYNNWDFNGGQAGVLKMFIFAENLTIKKMATIKKVLKICKEPQERAKEIIETLKKQKAIYLWYLQAVNNVRHKMIEYLENGKIHSKEFKNNIQILKTTFDRYKKIKDKTEKYIAEFEKMAGDK